jgi:DNA-binding IscR family transcriptional regulator
MPKKTPLRVDRPAAEAIPEDVDVARIVARLGVQYVLRAFQLLIDAHGDIRAGLIVHAINAANVSHIDGSTVEGQRAAASDGLFHDETREPVSISRLAQLTGLPRDSTRRIVQRLIDAGACVRADGGVIVPRALLESAEIARAATTNLRYVRELVRHLLAFGLVEDAPAEAPAWEATGGERAMARGVARFSRDYILQVLKLLANAYGDIRVGVVAQTIVTANTAHLEAPMGEGWRYAGIDQPPPDEVRRPVSVAAVAVSLGVPYETLRRQVRRLIEAGVCVRIEGGLIVPMAVLEHPAGAEATLANVRNVRNFVRNLWSIGFDPNEP